MIERSSGSWTVAFSHVPAAGRLDRRECSFPTVGERAEQDLVVGTGTRQPSASARATWTDVSEPLNESGAMRIVLTAGPCSSSRGLRLDRPC